MMTAEAMKEMEEFREANREYISRDWHLDKNRSKTAGSPRHVYSRRLDNRPPSFAASPNNYPLEPTRYMQGLSSSGAVVSSAPKTTSSSSKPWFDDPELKRQKRVVKYKSYAVEGKMKASLRSSFRWIKNKYSTIVHGY